MTAAALPRTVDRVEPADDRSTHRLYTSNLTREHGFAPLRVEGRLPEELRGTIYRTGPGLFDSFGMPYDHSFVADGAVVAVRFDGGRALAAHRIVQTPGLVKERSRGKPLYSSVASYPRRLWNAVRFDVKNSANTSMLYHDERLYALFEAGRPTELDPETLETRGERDLGIERLSSFTAHPHPVASRRTTYAYGLDFGRKNTIELFALPWDGPSRRLGSIPLERGVMLHDAAVTEKHFVFFVCPVEVVLWRALLGIGGFRDLWKWNPARGTEVIVVPIDAPNEARRFHTDAFFFWHVANAFERGDEIAVDLVHYDDLETLDQLGMTGMPLVQGISTRVMVEPRRSRISSEALSDVRADFPVIDARVAGAEHRITFLSSDSGPRAAIVRLESGRTQRYELEPGERPSEVLFAPSGDREGQGWAISLVFSARTGISHWAVFDAERIEDGPIARAYHERHIPVTFHGTFVPA